MEIMEVIGVPYFKSGSGIHIKKKNRGKFTEYCGGEVTQECINKAKKSKNPTLRKRATFAENARAWKHQEGGPIDYSKVIRQETDADVPKWNQVVYTQFNPAWGYPNLMGAIVNGSAAAVRSLSKNPKMQYEIVDGPENKAGDNYWRYRLGLSVDPEHFGEILDDGSVTLPQYVEREIPTDTTALKKKIAANEEFIKNNQFTKKEWDIANGLLKTDKETLEALRHTYKTGAPVVINEFSYNSRPLLKDKNYTEDKPTPLNMLQNYTIQYNPSDNTMYYRDVYDFNQFEKFVPGESYKINGAIQLPKKKVTKNQFGGKTKFHQNWLNQRIPILAKNAKTSEAEAQKLADKQIEDLKNTPEYLYDTPQYYKGISIQDQYDAENAFDNGAYALYDTEGKFIVYQDPYLKDFAKTHERTHAMRPIEQELAITKYKNEKRKIFANPKQKYDRYLDSSTEVYARLMDARQKYKLDPKKTYTKEDLPKIREQIKKDWGIDETNIFNRYDDEYILHLLNDIAQNDSPKQFDDVQYAQTGGAIKRLDIESLKADPEYKNNYNWYIHDANINALQDSLINRNAGYAQRIAALSMVIPESGGKPDPHGNGAVGLIGWRGERAKGLPTDFGGQAHELMNGLFSNDEALHWSHGGTGTGVATGKEMYNLYNNSQNVNQATSAIMKGYVRPEKSEYQKRLEFAQLLKRHMK